jgi:uncharacterized protein YfdQ (DUF2303 family)
MTKEQIFNNPTDSVIELVERLNTPEVLVIKGQEDRQSTEVLIIPKGLEVHSVKQYLDEYLNKPERRKGTARLTDLNSFKAHVNRFKDIDSTLFADNRVVSPSISCVFDYHRQGAEGSPRFGEHRAFYAFPLSKEWQAWTKINAQEMGQGDFAEVIENRISDVIAPSENTFSQNEHLKNLADLLGGSFASPQRLVELSRGLSVRSDDRVQQATNLSTGEAVIQYTSEHKDHEGQPLKVPNLFLIAIPVFESGPLYQIAVRLRYRVRNGGIKWFFELYRTDKVFDHAFDEACKDAATETGLPLFIGGPEQ